MKRIERNCLKALSASWKRFLLWLRMSQIEKPTTSKHRGGYLASYATKSFFCQKMALSPPSSPFTAIVAWTITSTEGYVTKVSEAVRLTINCLHFSAEIHNTCIHFISHAYVYTYKHTYTHTHISFYISCVTHMYIHTNIHTHIHTNIHTYTCILHTEHNCTGQIYTMTKYKYKNISVRHTHVHSCKHTYTHVSYIRAHIYTYLHELMHTMCRSIIHVEITNTMMYKGVHL